MKAVLLTFAFIVLKVGGVSVDVDEWERALSLPTATDQHILWETQSCGPNMKCVPPSLCLNGRLNTDGSFLIHPRSTLSQCGDMMECCLEDDVKKESNLESAPASAGCGHRNLAGAVEFQETAPNRAKFGEFPWLMAVFEQDEFSFGGSLLHPKVVLTAAHRVTNKQPSAFIVRAGEWKRSSESEPLPHQDREVEKIIVHRDYHRRGSQNNVALLILKTAFDLSPHIATICLPPSGFNSDNADKCILAGWGKSEYTSQEFSDMPKKMELKVVSKERCRVERRWLHASTICATGKDGVYRGDGGSALVCPMPNSETRYYQVGVASTASRHPVRDVPEMYADTATLRPWIETEFKRNNLSLIYF